MSDLVDVSLLFAFARSKQLEKLGIQPMPIRDSWDVEDDECFPDYPFVLRGDAASDVFAWDPWLLQKWNEGKVDADQFVEDLGGFNISRTTGDSLTGFSSSSRTISFEIEEEGRFSCSPHPRLEVMSKACLAAKGSWFTCPHIEWGGGESVAALISGSKLWIMATTRQSAKDLYRLDSYRKLCDVLMPDDSSRSSKKRRVVPSFLANLVYHIGKPHDVIIQPAFACHCVITEPILQDGEPTWSLVTGYEGIDIEMPDRGRLVFNSFALEMDRNRIQFELNLYRDFGYVVRLLKVQEYREAERRCMAAGRTDIMDFYSEKNAVTHCKILWRAGYDLIKSLNSADQKFNKKFKSSRQQNLKQKRGRELVTILSEATIQELSRWGPSVREDLDESADRRVN